ncbi:MAG: ABC transporter permease [Mycoplasmatales bacterium]
MTNVLGVINFHFHQYIRNNYFLTLIFSTTISFFLIEYLIAYNQNELLNSNVWLRAGIFGLWNSTITSAGIINFQRFQGTLIYLINNKISDRLSFICLIIPSSLFGAIAFVISLVCYAIFTFKFPTITFTQFITIFCLVLSCMIISFFLAQIFILTKNGIVYEPLIAIPLLLVSGFFSYAPSIDRVLLIFDWLIPIAAPIKYLLNTRTDFFLPWICSSMLWLLFSYVLSS